MNYRQRRDYRGYKKYNKSHVLCSVCNKPIRELNTAMESKKTGNLAHFDCVLDEIKQTEELLPNEKICYLGMGTFGIIKYLSYSSSPIRFLIRKRINYHSQ